MRYKALILIDRDGQETRDERRTLDEGKRVFAEYLAIAKTDPKVFSLTLVDMTKDKVISNWERKGA